MKASSIVHFFKFILLFATIAWTFVDCAQNKIQNTEVNASEAKPMVKKDEEVESTNQCMELLDDAVHLSVDPSSIKKSELATDTPHTITTIALGASSEKYGTSNTETDHISDIKTTGVKGSVTNGEGIATSAPAKTTADYSAASFELYSGLKSSGDVSPATSLQLQSLDAQNYQSGQLTSGEINDFQKWTLWQDIKDTELNLYRNNWKISPENRYSVQLTNNSNSPIVDCEVRLLGSNNEILWTSRTDNTGKAELWGSFSIQNEPNKAAKKIIAINEGIPFELKQPTPFHKGINHIKIPSACSISDNVDICFAMDATGSMGDEIGYLQAELIDVMKRIQAGNKTMVFNLGSVFYRDLGETYVTKQFQFTQDIHSVNQFIKEQYADGGGDGPEAVDQALQVAIHQLNWSENARTRLLFLVLDAPPHDDDSTIVEFAKSVSAAAKKGIRIIPIVASGSGFDLDKSLEYLMRSVALATNGTYGFITDDSGIGDSHSAPSTDKFTVEKLNNMLIRIMEGFIVSTDCDLEFTNVETIPQDTVSVFSSNATLPTDSIIQLQDSIPNYSQPIDHNEIALKCYPNPTTDYLWVQASAELTEIFIADNSGKLMEKITLESKLTRLDLTNYPSGLYLIRALINNKWLSAKITVARLH